MDIEIEKLTKENQELKERMDKLEKYIDYLIINTNSNRVYNVKNYNRQIKKYTKESYEELKNDIISKTDNF